MVEKMKKEVKRAVKNILTTLGEGVADVVVEYDDGNLEISWASRSGSYTERLVIPENMPLSAVLETAKLQTAFSVTTRRHPAGHHISRALMAWSNFPRMEPAPGAVLVDFALGLGILYRADEDPTEEELEKLKKDSIPDVEEFMDGIIYNAQLAREEEKNEVLVQVPERSSD